MKKNPRGASFGASLLFGLVAAFGAAAGCSPDAVSGATSSSGGGGGSGGAGGSGGPSCTPGATESCYDGPAGTEGVGICKAGTHACRNDGQGFGACTGQVEPRAENCSTPADEDCNGKAETEFPGCCVPGALVGCYSGPAGTEWVGICKPGTQACNDAGTMYSPCVGETLPQVEDCNTPVDDDCDGSLTNGSNCCKEGDSRDCYDGPVGTEGVGLCVGGTQICKGDGSGFGACMGEVTPKAEKCDTLSTDENCDGSSICTGAHVWSKRFGNMSQTVTAAVDRSGNTALIGSFDGTTDFGGGVLTSAGSTDVYLAKLSAAGSTIFSKRFGDASSQSGNAVAFDKNGDIYVAGGFQGTIDLGGGPLTSAGSDDVFLAKLDSNGKAIWTRQFGGSGSEEALGVGVDDLGNVYAAGTFSSTIDFGGGPLTSVGGDDLFLVSFDLDGNHLWSKRAGDVASESVGGMAVDLLGNMYVTGRFTYSIDFGNGALTSAGADDLFAVKLDQFGDPLWSLRAGDLSSQSGTAIAVDALGNVFLGGDFQGSADLGAGAMVSAGAGDIFVARLDGSGSPVWNQRFGDAADQHLEGVAVDATGNVVLTGEFQGTMDFGDGPHVSAGGNDIFVAKLDASGTTLWSKAFGDSSFAQSGKSVSTDSNGSVIVSGVFGGSADFGGGPLTCKGTANAFVVKLGP